MAENSKIEWTKHTNNLWWGCVEVHAGCDNCYARVLDNRWGGGHWGNESPRKIVKSVWNNFIKYQKLAKEADEIHRVFVGSMMDIFEKPMPLVDFNGKKMAGTTEDLRNRYFNEIVPSTPNLLHLMLTKRPSNINKYIPESWKNNPPKNVMFGTSPIDQETANTLIPQLLKVKGYKFLSVEPQLGEVILKPEWIDQTLEEKINWIIVGGESGANKRPFNPDWARKLRDQCLKAGLPFFMKQWDKVKEIPADLEIKQYPNLFS